MNLKPIDPAPEKPPGPWDRVRAGLGLAALVLVWLVALVPCAILFGVSLLFNAARPQAGRLSKT